MSYKYVGQLTLILIDCSIATFGYIYVLLYYRAKMKIEELRSALKDKEIKTLFLDMLTEKIEEFVQSCATKLIDGMTEKLNKRFDGFVKKFDDINTNVMSLRAEVQRKDAVIDQLKDENLQLKSTVQSLTSKLDESEAYQRRENLIISGLQCRMADMAAATTDALSESSTTVTEKVINFCSNVLQCQLTASDISVAHTLPTKAGSTQPPAVIVRFVRRSVRDEVFASRRKLKTYTNPAGGKVYINEDLTALNRKILGILRLKVRNHAINGAWSQSGRILAKDLRGNIRHISTVADAQDFS